MSDAEELDYTGDSVALSVDPNDTDFGSDNADLDDQNLSRIWKTLEINMS